MKQDSDLKTLRHSAAHVMAAAVCRLFKDVQLDIGPATDDGFYYDFDLPHRLTPEDLPRIEEEMRRIQEENHPFERIVMSRSEAEEFLRRTGQQYKLERLADIPADEEITFYRSGDFIDLCRGPHVETTGAIGVFKLLSVAGSYYRGRETNPMLQRIYGTAFPSAEELAQFLQKRAEAQKRDHRRLGKTLDLFSIHDEVGPGLIHWHPKASMVRYLIEDFWRREHLKRGYQFVYSPHIGRSALWETSGHLDFYRASMYSPMKVDEEQYFIKPMNCPFHILIYKTSIRSYRQLPLRWAELGTVYRYEKAGVLHGLLRVRGFTQDDAHIFCTPEQVAAEIRNTLRFAMDMWKAFDFQEISAFLSTRPDKYVGDAARWDQATQSLESALQDLQLPYEIDPGGGAFYGPKIDIHVKDALGRDWQTSTIQFDFNLPEKFDMEYIAEDGRPHRPYLIHRALLGSMERFFGILLEHYAGAFPFWLAPEQVRILPVSEKTREYAQITADRLRSHSFRVSVDARPDKINARIRDAQMEKIPYMAIVGPREAEAGTVSLRSRSEGDLGAFSLDEILHRFEAENRPPSDSTAKSVQENQP